MTFCVGYIFFLKITVLFHREAQSPHCHEQARASPGLKDLPDGNKRPSLLIKQSPPSAPQPQGLPPGGPWLGPCRALLESSGPRPAPAPPPSPYPTAGLGLPLAPACPVPDPSFPSPHAATTLTFPQSYVSHRPPGATPHPHPLALSAPAGRAPAQGRAQPQVLAARALSSGASGASAPTCGSVSARSRSRGDGLWGAAAPPQVGPRAPSSFLLALFTPKTSHRRLLQAADTPGRGQGPSSVPTGSGTQATSALNFLLFLRRLPLSGRVPPAATFLASPEHSVPPLATKQATPPNRAPLCPHPPRAEGNRPHPHPHSLRDPQNLPARAPLSPHGTARAESPRLKSPRITLIHAQPLISEAPVLP